MLIIERGGLMVFRVIAFLILVSVFSFNLIAAFYSWYNIRFRRKDLKMVLIDNGEDAHILKDRQLAIAFRIAQYELELKENKCYSL